MSKILGALEIAETGQKYSLPMLPIEVGPEEYAANLETPDLYEFKIYLLYEAHTRGRRQDKRRLLEIAAQRMRVAIYGEVRELMLDLMEAAYAGDRTRVIRLTEEMATVMGMRL